MGSISGQNDSLMNEIQPDLIPYNSDEHDRCWTSDQDTSSPSDLPSSPSTVHKASWNRFFVWAATTRLQINLEPDYSCPMIGCDIELRSLDTMLNHLRICTYFAKGYYLCPESGRKEKVGKCGTAGCQELKGRLVTAVSSGLKTVKRHFSGRSGQSPKTREATESTFTKSSIPHEPLEMSASSDRAVGVAELFGSSIPLEMEDTCSYSSPNSNPSELGGTPMTHEGTKNDSLNLTVEDNNSHDSRYHRYLPDALDPSDDLSSAAPAYTIQSQEDSSGMGTHQEIINISSNAHHAHNDLLDYTTDDYGWVNTRDTPQTSHVLASYPSYDQNHINNAQSYVAGVNKFALQHDVLQEYQSQGQLSQIETRSCTEQGHTDEFSYPVTQSYHIPQISNHASCSTHQQPRAYSGTSSDTSESISVFSAVRRSTQDSATPSVDLISSPLNDGQSCSVSFFGDGPSVFFEEAESMDGDFESAVPSSFPTRENYHQSVNPNTYQVDANGVSYDDYDQPRDFVSRSQALQYSPPRQVPSPRHSLNSATGTGAIIPPQSPMPPAAIRIAHPQPRRRQTARKPVCRHCHVPKHSSNIPRHEKGCRLNPNRPKEKPFKCPGCDSRFTRVDNGGVHQRRVGHLGNLELHVRFTPSSASPEMHMVLDEREREMWAEHAEIFNSY